jgi:hypothetical protein
MSGGRAVYVAECAGKWPWRGGGVLAIGDRWRERNEGDEGIQAYVTGSAILDVDIISAGKRARGRREDVELAGVGRTFAELCRPS